MKHESAVFELIERCAHTMCTTQIFPYCALPYVNRNDGVGASV